MSTTDTSAENELPDVLELNGPDRAEQLRQLIPDPEEQPTVEVRLAGQALGLGATTTYERARTGQLIDGVPVLKVGGKYRVVTATLRRALGLK